VIELLMVFAGGLLGSSHCVGMCGAFALALGSTGQRLLPNLARQVLYGMGRTFTYTVAGVAAGYAGARATQEQRLITVQAILSITAGVLLIVQGLAAAGLRAVAGIRMTHRGCAGADLFAALLRETRFRDVFLGGLVNGLLPCGLVYAYLALAASSGGLWRGGITMAVFGLGTLPILAIVGIGGLAMSLTGRSRMLRVAAWCVVLAGVLSLARGVNALPLSGQSGGTSCPACR